MPGKSHSNGDFYINNGTLFVDELNEFTEGHGIDLNSSLNFGMGLSADTISELTPGSGVTIDGVLAKDGGVQLLTTGGTKYSLDHYEEYDWAISLASTLWGGDSPLSVTAKITRIGRQVFIQFPQTTNVSATVTTTITNATTLPARFRRSISNTFTGFLFLVNMAEMGMIAMNQDGTFTISKTDGSSFSNTGTLQAGFNGFTLSYNI
jgi:hypothetical protein